MVCVGSGDGPWRWLSGAHLPGSCTCRGQRQGGRQGLWAPAGSTVLLPESWLWWVGCRWGSWVLWLWGWASRPPVCWGLHRRAPKPPGLRRFSQNPVFTLPASELLLFVFFFISDCCAQDCESEKSPRSQHQCKHTRVYLQARTCVQVYPIEQSRDLDPEVGISLFLRAGLGEFPKGRSNSSSSVYILKWGHQGHWDLF